MKRLDIFDLYYLISKGTENVSCRKQALNLRQAAFVSFKSSGHAFTKVAFDTRRIDQETEYNPRRGLQNYQRSQDFVNQNMGQKIKNFAKVRRVLADLKNVYGKEPEWQDSNCRVLLSTLDKGLRVGINDGDFSESQPGVGSLDYIEELMHVRYRLGFDQLTSMAEADLRRVILSKDEEFTRKDVNQSLEITKRDVATQAYDTLMDKLFNGCRASEENPDVERTVTITIRDKFNKQG